MVKKLSSFFTGSSAFWEFVFLTELRTLTFISALPSSFLFSTIIHLAHSFIKEQPVFLSIMLSSHLRLSFQFIQSSLVTSLHFSFFMLFNISVLHFTWNVLQLLQPIVPFLSCIHIFKAQRQVSSKKKVFVLFSRIWIKHSVPIFNDSSLTVTVHKEEQEWE